LEKVELLEEHGLHSPNCSFRRSPICCENGNSSTIYVSVPSIIFAKKIKMMRKK
jgi:hypothetical protein